MTKRAKMYDMSRRTLLKTAAGTAAAGILGVGAARAFPAENITVIVPYAPGSTDQTVRTLGQHLEKILGKPVIVETRPGAGGTIGAGDRKSVV